MAAGSAQTTITEELRFVENGAGTYTGTFNLPANATIKDICVHAEALWTAATSAVMKIGDATDDDGFFTAVNLKATDLLAGESINFTAPGGKQGADVDVDAAGAQHVRRRYSAAARAVSAVVTSVGAGTAGRTRVTIEYAVPGMTTITQ